MRRTINIDFDNSSSSIIGFDPDLLSASSTAFAYSTHTHGSIHLHLSNITGTFTSVSNGITLELSAGTAGGNVVFGGTNITLSTDGISTTVSATNLAQANHAHGTNAAVSGLIAGTISSDGWSLSIPDFAGTGFTSTALVAGIVPTGTLNSNGLKLGVPSWLTTAAQVSHSHGSVNIATIAGTDVTYASASSGLTLGFPAFLTTYGGGFDASLDGNTSGVLADIHSGTLMLAGGDNITLSQNANAVTIMGNTDIIGSGTTITTIAGTDLAMTLNTDGLEIDHPAWLTTGVQIAAGGTTHTSGTLSTVDAGTVIFYGGNNITLSQDSNSITISGTHIYTDIKGLAAEGTTFTSGTVYFSAMTNMEVHTYLNGASQYIRLSMPDFIGTTTAATNVGITANTAGLRISVDTAGMTAAGDGVNILAVNGTTAESAGTILFADSNGVGFGLSTKTGVGSEISTMTASYTVPGATVFSNSNNVSFGINGSTVTATATYAQTVEPRVVSINGTSGSLTFNAGTFLSLSQNGLSFTYYVTDTSAITTAAFPSANTTKFAGPGFTTNATAGTALVGTLNSSGLNLGVPAFLTVQSAEPRVVSVNGTSGSLTFNGGSYLGITQDGVSFTWNVSNTTAFSSNAFASNNSSNLLAVTLSTKSIGVNTSISSGYNGSTLAMSANSSGITLSVPAWLTTAAQGASWEIEGTHSAGTTGSAFSTLYLSGGNNVTLSGNSNTIIFSVADAAGQSYQPVAFSGSNTSTTASTLSFGNSNDLSFYITNGSLVGSGAFMHVSDTGSIVFADSNDITFGSATAGSTTTITASFSQSTHTHDLTQFVGLNTSTQSTGGTALTMSLNSSGITMGLPAWLTTGGGGGGGGGAVSASNGSFTFETLSLGSSQITFYTNASGIQASYTVPPSGTLSFVNSNGVTFGYSSDGSTTTVTASVNTVGGGGDWATATTGGSAIDISTGATNTLYYGEFITGYTESTHAFTEYVGLLSTGITGGSATINSSQLLIELPAYLTGYTESTHAFTEYIGLLSTGITGGSATINSSQLYIDLPAYLTGYSESTHDFTQYVGLLTTGITGASATINSSQLKVDIPQGSVFYNDSNGIVFGASSSGSSTTITASLDQIWQLYSGTAGTSSSSFGSELKLVGGNNITLSGGSDGITFIGVAAGGAIDWSCSTTDGSGITVVTGATNTLSYGNFITTQTVPTNFVGLASTGVTGASATINSSQLYIELPAYLTGYTESTHAFTQYVGLGSTGITGGSATINSSQLYINIPTYAGSGVSTGSTSGGTDIAGTLNTAGLSLVYPAYLTTGAASGHSHGNPSLSLVNLSGATNSASNGLTLSLSGLPAGTLSFVNSNGITFGYSSDGSTTTVTASAWNMPILSNWVNPVDRFTPIGAIGQGSLSIKYISVPFIVSGSVMKIGGSVSAATGDATNVGSANMSLIMAVYTLNGSTLSLASSGSANNAFTWHNSDSSTDNIVVNSMRQLTAPVNVSMTPGQYWIAAVINSATTYTSAGLTIFGGGGLVDDAATIPSLAALGASTNASSMVIPFQGIYTATTAAMPASIGKAAIDWTSASNVARANFYNAIYASTY